MLSDAKLEPTSLFQAGVTLLHWGAEVLCSHILLFAQPLPLSQTKWVVSDTSSHLFCHHRKQHRLALLLGWRWLPPEGAGGRASAPCSSLGHPRQPGSDSSRQGSFSYLQKETWTPLRSCARAKTYPSHQIQGLM